MRYLSSISLALIVVMAFACTATPAAPMPAAPTPSGAFSCQELADKLAAAHTETAAMVLTRSWNESGCAQKAAGVTKVPTARPTTSTWRNLIRPTLTSGASWAESLFTKTPGYTVPKPVPTDTPVPPTVTPDPWANANLKDRWGGLVSSYLKTLRSEAGKTTQEWECLVTVGKNGQATYYPNSSPDYWLVEVSGYDCKGIETWKIYDDTGKVTYVGSSLDK
jgi:hypothetical protein